MEKPIKTTHSVCDNCGKWMDTDHATLTPVTDRQPVLLCSERCDSEHRANIALRNMTWGTAS